MKQDYTVQCPGPQLRHMPSVNDLATAGNHAGRGRFQRGAQTTLTLAFFGQLSNRQLNCFELVGPQAQRSRAPGAVLEIRRSQLLAMFCFARMELTRRAYGIRAKTENPRK